ncbi:metallophosphoesterase [Streptomyces sp. NPDC092296]|uniref:metallophosphoesterase n=1 Tax=Streptomyces sp. NPDC092296 TaxID=3366012 RepID=UPI00381E7B0C
MTPEDRFPGPELPETGPRARLALDPLSYGYESGDHGGPQQPWAGPGYGGQGHGSQGHSGQGHGGQGHGGPGGAAEGAVHSGESSTVRGWFEAGGGATASGFDPDAPGRPPFEPTDPPTLDLGAPVSAAPPAGAPDPLPEPADTAPVGPLYAVGDVHGYLGELRAALYEQGLVDADGHWSAARSRLWFLGDFTDRGPDGIGVIDLVMQLAAEAAAAGGYCRALMGNHELLLLGAHRYADEPVQSSAGTASFLAAWRLNGGQQNDMDRLEPHHIRWLSRLPAVALEDGHLLLHSDTTAYLEYGASIDEVNDTVHELLASDDADGWWDCFRRFTRRFAFRGEAGPAAAGELLEAYGGHRVVHGHSPIPYLTGEAPGEDGRPPLRITGPHVYADELAVAMDGGVTMDGRLLVARLPLE